MHRRLAVLLALILGALLLGPGVAHTATPSNASVSFEETDEPDEPITGPAIRVRLLDQATAIDGEDPTPVPDVTVAVETADGDVVGEAVSNDLGVAAIPIEGRGTYIVTIDEGTLPDGVELSGSQELTVNVTLDSGANVAFPLNQGETISTSFAQRLVDSLVAGVKFGLIIGLAALGLSLIFGTTGLSNFSHGELITFGALSAYVLNQGLGLPVVVAGMGAVVLGGIFGWAQDRGLWRPLRNRGIGVIAMMIVSIGFGLLLRNLYQYFFGTSTLSFSDYTGQARDTYFGFIRVAPKEIAIIVIAIVVISAVCIAMAKTRLGKAMRAVSDNPDLSASSGMRVDGVISSVWILGTALTALAGVLQAVNVQIDFLLGFKLLLLVFAAVTLGGFGTIWGALLGSMVIGIMVESGPLFGVPTSMNTVGALVVMILILLIRPQGILGRAQRIG